MKRSMRLFCTAALAATATMVPALAADSQSGMHPADETQGTAQRVTLYAGEVKVIPIRKVKQVALGNGKLVSVQQAGKQLILIGQAAGTTNMLLWMADGSVQAYNIQVTPQDSQQVSASLSAALSGVPGLHVDGRGGRVVLSGDVTVDDYKRVQQATQGVEGVINLAHPQSVDMQRMVYLDVQVVDFKKSALRNIGIDWQNQMAGPVLGIVKDVRSNPYYRVGDLKQGGTAANQFIGPGGQLTGLPTQMPYAEYFGITTSLSSMINLAAQNGDAYILANPQLSTRSGGEASFLAGGQIPIPISSVLGQSTVQYKDYGVQLNIKPHADAQGNIMADINTEISQIDPSVTINSYPGFLTRKTSSVVNVKSGQTIVMSGLVQATGSDSMDKFPWLGDIPVLGALFRNKNFQANKDELVIFVTPVIITPDSPVNHEVIDRGTEMIDKFNKEYGNDVDMPGFGVGPASHSGNAPAQAPQASAPPVAAPPAAAVAAPATATQTYPITDGHAAATVPPPPVPAAVVDDQSVTEPSGPKSGNTPAH